MQTFRKLPTIAPKTAAITREKRVMLGAAARWPQAPRAAATEAMSRTAGRGRPSRARTAFPPDRPECRGRRLRVRALASSLAVCRLSDQTCQRAVAIDRSHQAHATE